MSATNVWVYNFWGPLSDKQKMDIKEQSPWWTGIVVIDLFFTHPGDFKLLEMMIEAKVERVFDSHNFHGNRVVYVLPDDTMSALMIANLLMDTLGHIQVALMDGSEFKGLILL